MQHAAAPLHHLPCLRPTNRWPPGDATDLHIAKTTLLHVSHPPSASRRPRPAGLHRPCCSPPALPDPGNTPGRGPVQPAVPQPHSHTAAQPDPHAHQRAGCGPGPAPVASRWRAMCWTDVSDLGRLNHTIKHKLQGGTGHTLRNGLACTALEAAQVAHAPPNPSYNAPFQNYLCCSWSGWGGTPWSGALGSACQWKRLMG